MNNHIMGYTNDITIHIPFISHCKNHYNHYIPLSMNNHIMGYNEPQ